MLGDREAESGAAVFTGHAAVRLTEGLEQSLHGIRAHADPAVHHRKFQDRLLLPARHNIYTDVDCPVVGELDGIAEQIVENLPQAQRIAE